MLLEWIGGFDSSAMCRCLPRKRYVITYLCNDRNGACSRLPAPHPMDNQNAEYDIADHIDDSRPRSGNSPRPICISGYVGHVVGFRNVERMTRALSSPRRLLHRWTLLAGLVLWVGQSVADTHLHLDEHEEEACTLCAISEPGHVLDAGCVDARSSEWHRSNSAPVFSATLAPRPYEIGHPRDPPIS